MAKMMLQNFARPWSVFSFNFFSLRFLQLSCFLLQDSLGTLGITEAEQDDIFRVVASVLWLGNLTFLEDNNEASTVQDKDGLC